MSESERQMPESGLFSEKLHFVREDITGETPDDPDYLLFSDNVVEWSYAPGMSIERRDGVGTSDARTHDMGIQEPELSITYDLQRPLIDADGDPEDASVDAWERTSSNTVRNTQHVRIVESRDVADPDDPDGVSGVKTFVIAHGCYPNVEQELDPEDGRPIRPVLTYMCEKVREYEVFQPDDDQLEITLDDDNDQGVTVTIEDEEGNSEDVEMTTSEETTTKEDWDSITAIELDDETEGDVTVSIEGGSDLATIRGAAFYGQGDESLEGDLGIPALGSGSIEDSIDSSYVYFHGTSVKRDGDELDYDLNRMSMNVDNSYEAFPRHDSVRQRINEGNRVIELEADVIGWGASVEFYEEAVGLVNDDIEIELSNTKFTFNNAVPTSPGDKERGAEDTAVAYSVIFEPQASAVSIENNE